MHVHFHVKFKTTEITLNTVITYLKCKKFTQNVTFSFKDITHLLYLHDAIKSHKASHSRRSLSNECSNNFRIMTINLLLA